MRRLLLTATACLALGLATFAAGCGDDDEGDTSSTSTSAAETTEGTTDEGGASAQAGAAAVEIAQVSGNQFDPVDATAKVGETVVWTNEDTIAHNVVADGGEFESETMEPGATFEWKADLADASEVSYVCTFHPGMEGTITLEG